MNKVQFSGNLVKDAESIALKSGSVLTKFRLAVKSAYKDKEGNWTDGETLFINVNHFNGTALDLKKGDPVEIEGRLRENKWENDGKTFSRFEVIAYNVKKRERNNGSNGNGKAEERSGKEPTPEELSILEPF